MKNKGQQSKGWRGFRPINPPKTKEAEENFKKYCTKKK